MDGSTGRRRPPIIMGHEASGVIAEVGGKVTGWNKGERVTFDSTVYCGSCWFCQRGLINLCDHRRVLGVSCEDYRQHGAFAEYVAVPQRILYRLPEAVSFEHAAMVEAVSVAVHAVERTPISLGDTAVVVGAGMIGLLVVQALRLAGCGKIIAVDLDEERLNLARRLGADVSLKADGCNVSEEVKHCTGGRGADVAMEVVGTSPSVNRGSLCAQGWSSDPGWQSEAVGRTPPSSGGYPANYALRQLRFQRRIPGLSGVDGARGDQRRSADQRHASLV